ncbi:hypothetical protein PoB_003260200 [Plakobranchus ocellatus]|uniref:Uncharacterized protein n=1 Tax=Plakobranchus ocellatus TaxID=259542 RepID=A0AAV4AFS0_9GAST|nr:hypothetical protein PoB_003260200 [Plakobranchus ocellatus]
MIPAVGATWPDRGPESLRFTLLWTDCRQECKSEYFSYNTRSASAASARKINSDQRLVGDHHHRGGATTATSSTDDDSLLDIVMDGREDEGHADPNQLQCEYT